MIFSSDIEARVAIFILGICGFLVARHIFKHKNNDRNPLVCPIKFDCHTVVHSDYSKLFGIPVEILGMFYYALVSIFYLISVFVPGLMPLFIVKAMIGVSFVAFFFSLYLIGIQIFVLRKGCSWCIVSAFISAFIFALTVAVYHLSYIVQIFVQ